VVHRFLNLSLKETSLTLSTDLEIYNRVSGSLVLRMMLVVLLLSPLAAAGQQVPLPPVDLGATSFPGDISVNAFAALTEVAYTTHYKFLGAWYGAEVLLPFAHADIQTDLGVRGTQGGMGDLIFSPLLLQWPEHKVFGKPYFQRLHVVELIVPTGRYSRDAAVNVGNNVVSVSPQYAGTLFLTPQIETSWRVHYLWNSKNNDPNPVYNANSIQPGQAVHFNASVSYKLQSRLRAGVAGYYLKGITDPKIGDRSLANSREQIGAIGPGLWFATRPFEVYLHAFFEMGAENRPQGVRFVFRIVKIFPKK
jgi:hypothetical protein